MTVPQRDQVKESVRLLYSGPHDSSTASESEHALKQARTVIGLLKIYFLREWVAIPDRIEIQGEYPPWSENLDLLALDVDGLERLRQEVGEDEQKIRDLPFDHPLVQAFVRKIVTALQKAVINLEHAARMTSVGYSLVERVWASDGMFLATFHGRHQEWAGVAYIQRLMGVVLPHLVGRLVALGEIEGGGTTNTSTSA